MLLIIASINFGILNKIRVKSKMSQNKKKGHGGKHTRPKKWSGARRPTGPATTALQARGILYRICEVILSEFGLNRNLR